VLLTTTRSCAASSSLGADAVLERTASCAVAVLALMIRASGNKMEGLMMFSPKDLSVFAVEVARRRASTRSRR
jgi:hypothetical protein